MSATGPLADPAEVRRHLVAAAAAAKNPALAKFIEECHHLGTAEAAIEKADKLGFDTGMRAIHTVNEWLDVKDMYASAEMTLEIMKLNGELAAKSAATGA